MTGHGLKDPDTAIQTAGFEPIVVRPDREDISVLYRGDLMAAVVAYEFVTAVVVMVLALLAQGFQRPSLFELPVLLAMLMFGGGLVFVRALERWL